MTNAENSHPKKRKMWPYIVVAVVLLPIVALGAFRVFSPRPKNLGVHEGKLSDCPRSPNCVCTQASDAGHQMPQIPFEGSPDEAMRRLKAVIAETPRMKIVAESDDYIRAEATTLVFRYVDDVEFLIDGNAKTVQFRSASRAGKSDLGANRARMQKLREAFEKSR